MIRKKGLVEIGAFALALVIGIASAAVSAERPPNIIYIMTDDLGYGDLGCYGQKTIQTPNIDRMAAEGMRFTDHYSGHTVCRPSRLVLWTGEHVGHTGLIGNRDRSLTGMESTVAQRLKNAGYATGGVGKWALGNVDDPSEVDNPGHPNNNGFDYWFGYLNQGNAHNFYPPFLWENKKQVAQSGNVLMKDNPQARGRVSSKKVTYSHDEMTDAAFKFVRQHKDDPFLLHIHWTIPHANNEGGRVLGDGMEVPDYGIYADEDWPNPEKGFAAMISRMDGDVGELFALLKELKIDDDTLVLFTSDNGPHQEGGHLHEYFDSNGALKGYKRSMHDGGIRVPLIARWPGKVAAGSVSDHPSAFWDFLPTACEIAGIDVTGHVDGISYLPTLLGKKGLQPEHEYLYWASSEGETSVGVRHGKWKLVEYRKSKKGKKAPAGGAQAGWRLYDLTQDIGEENDLAAKYPQVVERILGFLKRDGLDGNAGVDAKKADDKTVVALIGDSTVTDAAGWGKAFADRFSDRVEVINYAAGGRSSKSWLAEGRLPAVINTRPDYVLIQFGHNGQPGKGAARETDPATSYRDYLKIYIDKAREIGATPILISSVTRRRFDENGKLTTTLKPWADAAKAVAEETGTAFIDLHSLSFAYHEKVGAEESATFEPKEGDFTHFNEKGAEVISGLIAGELNSVDAELAALLQP